MMPTFKEFLKETKLKENGLFIYSLKKPNFKDFDDKVRAKFRAELKEILKDCTEHTTAFYVCLPKEQVEDGIQKIKNVLGAVLNSALEELKESPKSSDFIYCTLAINNEVHNFKLPEKA